MKRVPYGLLSGSPYGFDNTLPYGFDNTWAFIIRIIRTVRKVTVMEESKL